MVGEKYVVSLCKFVESSSSRSNGREDDDDDENDDCGDDEDVHNFNWPLTCHNTLLKLLPHLLSMPSDLLRCGGLSSSSSFGMGRLIRN